MPLRNTVTTLTHTVMSTAVNAARHPIDTTAQAAGLVKETAGAGIGLVRNRIGGAPKQAAAPTQETPTKEQPAVPAQEAPTEKPAAEKLPVKTAAKPVAKKAPAKKTPAQRTPVEDPRDAIPGPDLAPYLPPAPEDLPEPIVIEAE